MSIFRSILESISVSKLKETGCLYVDMKKGEDDYSWNDTYNDLCKIQIFRTSGADFNCCLINMEDTGPELVNLRKNLGMLAQKHSADIKRMPGTDISGTEITIAGKEAFLWVESPVIGVFFNKRDMDAIVKQLS